MKNLSRVFLLCCVLALITACDDSGKSMDGGKAAGGQETPVQKEKTLRGRLDAWLGVWDGPDGSSLKLEKSGEGYGITITQAGKEERYLGVSVPGLMKIRFRRNNTDETIYLGPDESTAESLRGKAACLIVTEKEAYCRDKL